MKKLIIFLLTFFSLASVAQTYNMSTTSISSCSGNFYDAQGSATNYQNSQDYTMTICPTTAGSKVVLNFSSFTTELNWDILYVYDGNSVAAPSLGAMTGTLGALVVSATTSNPTGCLTLVWHSDLTNRDPGWAASISCTVPCETINANLVSSTPAASGGIIRVCQGQSVSFTGSGTFGSGSSAGATYSWAFDNGTTGSGTTASTTYTAPGVYMVNLNITKAGCTNANKINQIVQVSTTPSFSATTASTTTICLGQSATLVGSVTPTPFIANCTPPISGVTYLPDGSGVSYSTSIVVDCYNSGATVTSAADIASICMSLEHSFLDDLDIIIRCPNGQQVSLKDDVGGGGTYLGSPNDDPSTVAGTGANYCFNSTATVLLINGPTVTAGSPAGPSIQAGTYMPAASLNGLIGCPLNGSWSLIVTDHAALDDGYIFNWDVNFNVAVPPAQSFTPTIVSETWTGPAGLTQVGNNATVTPTSTGSKCYTLTAVDNFGCSYTTQKCITVNPGPYAGVSNTLAVCSSAASTSLFGLLGTGVATTGTWSGPAPALTGGNVGTFNPALYTAGTYNYTYTVPGSGSCPPATAVVSVTIRPNPSATLSFTNPTCGNNNGVVVINNTSSGGQTISGFASSLGSISGQTVTGLGAGTPVITLTNNFGCTFTVSATLTMTPGPTDIVVTPTNATCGNNNGSFTFGSPTGGTPTYSYSINGGAFTATSPTVNLPVGTYSVTVKDASGCTYMETTSIANIPGPTAIAGTTTQASCNTNNGTHNITGVTGGTAAYTYSVDGVSTGSLTTGLAAGTHTVLVRDANGCIFSRTFVIGTANGPSSFTVTSTNASCGTANGTSTVSAITGGTPTYSVSFDGGAFGTSLTTSGLSAGTHTATVKDANSCTITATYNVASNAAPTAAVTSSLNILCNGSSTGSLTVAPSGGTAPFTYTLTAPTQTNATGAFTGLAAGAYSVTIRDNAGCTATVSATLTQPTAVTGTTSSIPVNCFGNSTGTVSAGGSGGVGPYTYLWPALGSSTLATVGGAAAGTYTVTIKDANLCTITRTVTVTQPTSLTLTSTLTAATCGNANGSGTVTVGGGTTPYSYNWDTGSTTATLSLASAGTHTVTVQDFNGCILTRTVTITNIPGPTAITGTTSLAGCNLNNGTYTVTGVTGGTPAYTYSVDAVATGSVTTGLAAGSHSVTVKDLNGCLFGATFNINTANGPTTATVATTNASCGTANGTATVTGVTGGTPTYSFSFDGGAFGTSATTSGLASGTHTVVVKDVNTCTLLVTYTELNNSGPTASVTASSNVLCNGGSTGSFTVTPSGGTAPFTYTLATPTQTNATGIFSGLPAGSYNVTVRDNSGCTATASVTLTQPAAVTLTVSSLPAACFGTATGTVSASGGGGTGTLTYLWPALGASTLATVPNVAAGTYSVTQTDANGCAITQTVTVTQPTSLTLTSTLTPATCGSANGSGTVTVGGGTPAYTYSWSTGSITNVLSGAAAGIHTVTVTDFKGCVLTRTVNITNIPGPTAVTGNTTLAGCGLSNGTYNVTGVTGGTSAYSFSVDAVATASLTSGLAAGVHSVTVSDANGCLFTTTFNIGTTPGPTSATVATNNSTCGSANGTSTVTGVTGGAPTYSYSFDGGTLGASASTGSLIAGTHTVTIKDANSCTLTTTYLVNNSGQPTSTVTAVTPVTCFGLANGSFTVAGSGGSGGAFTYTVTSPLLTNGTGQFVNLPANTYSIIIADGAGCTTTNTVTINQPPVLTLTATSIPAKCFGTNTGTINLTGAGGVPTYSYNLNAGLPYQASNTYTAVGNGIYTMGIKDANGCTATASVQVTQPTALGITVSSQPANCTASNGVASATVTGGTPLYTYTWTSTGGASDISNPLPGGTYTVTATDLNGCVISSPVTITVTPGGLANITASTNITCNGLNNGSMTAGMVGGQSPFTYSWTTTPTQTVATATNLAPGTYTCEITDFYGCKAYASGSLTQPSVLGAIMNSNNVKCFGTATGTVSAAGTGGAGGYTYLWPALSSTLSTVNNVAIGAGFYDCTITDANGCSITQSISITQPSSVTLSSTVTAANCNQSNGSATVTAAGGTPAYTYTWSTGSFTSAVGPVAAGTYTVDVKDANGCLQTLAATIPNIAGPSSTVTAQTNVSCNGGTNGSATVGTTGGVGTYTINWSSGQTTPTAANLSAGLHTVTVTDGAGCISSASVNITEPTALTVTITSTDPKCNGASNGSGLAAAFGGVPTYTYAWTGIAGSNALTNPIPAGSYGLIVTDGNGCTVTSSMTLNDPAPMTVAITSTNVTCFNACNGVAVATASNNVGIVSYYWTGGASPIALQTASGLCAGTYTVLATDQNSCTASNQVIITQPTQVTANITSSGSVTCNGGNDGFAVVAPGGGTPGYTYSWTGPSGSVAGGTNANNLAAGPYTVTVADNNTCTATANITILQPAPLTTTLTVTDPKCFNSTDGAGNVAFAGGAGTTTFTWFPNFQTGASVNNLSSGAQTVQITYNGSCTSNLTFTLNNPTQLTAATTATSSNCGQSNGKTCATVAGGIGPYIYLWSNGPSTLCNANIPAGPYTFTVTDANGCQANASGLINDIAGPTVLITSTTAVTCFNGSDGAATATITGGVTPYNIFWSLPNGSTTTSVTNFTAQTTPYNITVTDAANCVGTASVLITQPTQVVSAIVSQTNTSCFGYTDGGATMQVNGGISPYTYTWTPAAQNNPSMIGVAAGTYTCFVTDNNGCPTSQSVTIQQPTQMIMTNSLVTNITCNGYNNGQVATTIQGGSGMYTYSWTPSQPNNGTITNLGPGLEALHVTDSKGCFIDANFTVLEPSVITTSYASLPAKCGIANGSATVTVNGGTPNSSAPTYTMNWNTAPPQQGVTAYSMAPGSNWQCVVTDMNGCTATQTIAVANAPSPTLPTFTVTKPTCFGVQDGAIVIGYTSGTPDYQVTWSAPISVVQTSSATTQSVSNVGAGVYTATLTDSYGCTVINVVNVIQPSLVTLSTTATQTICYGTTTQISATGAGGTPGYTYTWNPSLGTTGGPYNVNPTTSSSYSVTIADANGCSPLQKVINVVVTPSLSISAATYTLCDGKSVALTPTITSAGNGGPYDFTWSNGTTNTSVPNSTLIVTGNYSVASNTSYTVTIDDGCTAPTSSAVFAVQVKPSPIISFTASPNGCAPLSNVLIATSNGVGDTFAWNFGDKNVIVGTTNPLPYTFTVAGTYTVGLEVTSALGCTSSIIKNNYITVYKKPDASFYPTPQSASILEPTIYFTNTSQGAISYDWNFGDLASGSTLNSSILVNPNHYYDHVGEYYVHLFATSSEGCVDEASVIVEITPDYALYIPNTFTPDGNNLNDVFQPFGVGIDEENYKMEIFDRWGESIFSSDSFRKGWDGSVKGGKQAPQGVYVYKLMVYDTQGGKHPYVGHVTVIRKDTN